MSAIFNFQSQLTVILLLIYSCAYIPSLAHSLQDRNKIGLLGIFWKCSRIGEQKSLYVAVCCIVMAFSFLSYSPRRDSATLVFAPLLKRFESFLSQGLVLLFVLPGTLS
ncbi:protein kish-A-like [Herpailurus yagouaroundi]|uniref:protein kish-A-like n=1 Tax=Herpailurus yagouaroundi TaxID=1608482 RepID=UPI001AD7E0D9|nr:protein kish-A-like [Puma yagouaroundi]